MLDRSLREWLDERAAELDCSGELSHALLQKLAEANLFRIGIAPASGGSGGTLLDAIDAISAVARHSLTAAFMFWGHRTYIDILTQAPESALRDRLLPDLLAGRLAGATGLSNHEIPLRAGRAAGGRRARRGRGLAALRAALLGHQFANPRFPGNNGGSA